MSMIRGNKGGKGGGGHTYHEDPNNLKSVSTAKVLDLISEGEIVGLVNGAKSIYLDDVPLQNDDGSFNFKGVSVEMRNGLPDQDFLPGFSQVEAFVSVGQEVKYNLPITHRIQDENLDAIIVTMEFPQLMKQNTENGDVLQYSVQFRVRIRADEGVWKDSGVITVAGKCISSFQRSYYFRVPQSQDGLYDIQVVRVSKDDDSASKHSITSWFGFSRVIEAKLNYPNRAVCGLTVRADQFGSNIPSRKYEVYGLIVQVPSNYDAWNHTYTSEVWDGTFKRSWTNNPAWIFYDLLTNGRYGLGRDIRPEYIDKYGLYMIGRYCDEMVSDGKGGKEPRFTFNGSIVNRESAYSVLNNLAGLFNSMIYYSGSVITLVQDSPKTPVRDFTPANVVDGNFSYEGVARSARHSVFQVTYSEPGDMYNSAIEVIENPDMIQDMGWKSSEITLIGCTSRGQARRRALRDIYTEQHETETVTFSVGIENADLVPGDIIRISDPSYAGARYGGRIVAIDQQTNRFTLDAETDFTISDNWMFGFLLPDNTWVEVPATTRGVSDSIVVNAVLEVYPEVGTVWTARCDLVEPRLFRVLSIKEDKPWQYTITGLLHYEQKYDVIENGADFVDGNFTTIPSGALKAPTNLTAEQYLHRVGDSILISINVAWNSADPRGINYMMRYKRNGDLVWTEAGYTASETMVLDNTDEDTYTIQVQAIDAMGRRSAFAEVIYDAPGYNIKVSDVPELRATISSALGVIWEWDAIPDFDFSQFILKVSNEIGEIPTTNLKYRSEPYGITGTLFASIVAENLGGNRSEHPATAEVEIVAPNAPIIRSAKVLDNGINIEVISQKGSWDVSYHKLTFCESPENTHLLQQSTGIFPVPSMWTPNGIVTASSCDIFKNWSEVSEPFVMTWYPPKTPSIKLGYNKLTGGITIDWQDCTNAVEGAPKITHYEITGTLTQGSVVSVTGTHYESVIPLTTYEMGTEEEGGIEVNVGTVSIGVTAVDKYGVTSKDAPNYKDNTVQLKIYPPYNPTTFGVSATPTDNDLEANWTSGGAIVLSWRDCTRTFAIDHYVVYDTFTKTSYKVSTNYVVLQARPEGSYPIQVTAYDVLGQSSSTMNYNLLIGGVSSIEVTASLDGADVLLEWSSPTASFQIDHYVIMQDNDTIPDGTNDDSLLEGFIGTAKTNYFRTPAGKAGSYTYYVWAVDIAGNVSIGSSYASVTVESPSAPKIETSLSGDGVGLKWIANTDENTLPILAWDVRRYEGKVNTSTIQNLTAVSDYGRLDVDTTVVPAFTIGTYTFAIRGIDSAGNEGVWGFAEFTATAPGQVTFSEPVVIDNNVQLYWSVPNKIFFPIKEYIFAETEQYDDGSEYSMEIGRVDAMFASETENESGTYVYSITPVDTGGNLGEPAIITCRVSQPPDFVFFDAYDSTFNGTKTNMVLDGKGSMLGPVLAGETWEQNLARIKTLTNLNITTHQGKVDAGYKTWLEPYVAEGKYVEVIDHGAIVPGSNLTVTLTKRTLAGNPLITCMIETSANGEDWDLISDNALQVYAAQFRYTRITLTITGGYVKISKIYVDLNVKKLTDYGRTTCYAADNGEGWESYEKTPMLTGTWIPFKVDFVTVQSLPKPNIIDNGNSEGYTAHTVFDGSIDNLNPEGFRVYVLDKTGKRVTAEVDWVAYGV